MKKNGGSGLLKKGCVVRICSQQAGGARSVDVERTRITFTNKTELLASISSTHSSPETAVQSSGSGGNKATPSGGKKPNQRGVTKDQSNHALNWNLSVTQLPNKSSSS